MGCSNKYKEEIRLANKHCQWMKEHFGVSTPYRRASLNQYFLTFTKEEFKNFLKELFKK